MRSLPLSEVENDVHDDGVADEQQSDEKRR